MAEANREVERKYRRNYNVDDAKVKAMFDEYDYVCTQTRTAYLACPTMTHC